MTAFMDVIHWIQNHAIIPVMAVFLAMAVWTYWPSHKSGIEAHGRLPLDDER